MALEARGERMLAAPLAAAVFSLVVLFVSIRLVASIDADGVRAELARAEATLEAMGEVQQAAPLPPAARERRVAELTKQLAELEAFFVDGTEQLERELPDELAQIGLLLREGGLEVRGVSRRGGRMEYDVRLHVEPGWCPWPEALCRLENMVRIVRVRHLTIADPVDPAASLVLDVTLYGVADSV